MHSQCDKKSTHCPNQRVEQRRPKANPLRRCKHTTRVNCCPSTGLKHIEQGGLGDLSAGAQNNGWGIRGRQLRDQRLGGHEGRLSVSSEYSVALCTRSAIRILRRSASSRILSCS